MKAGMEYPFHTLEEAINRSLKQTLSRHKTRKFKSKPASANPKNRITINRYSGILRQNPKDLSRNYVLDFLCVLDGSIIVFSDSYCSCYSEVY